MVESRKRKTSRKGGKAKAASGQKSLLDLFPVKAPAKDISFTENLQAQESEGDVATAPSSDVEFIESPEPASSPLPTDVDSVSSDGIVEVSVSTQDSSQVPLRRQHFRLSQTRSISPSSRKTNVQSSTAPGISFQNATDPEGRTREMPIVIDSSPSKLLHAIRSAPKALYPIFAPRIITNTSSTLTPRKRTHKSVEVPFPDCNTQHVRGPQTVFCASASSLSCLSQLAESCSSSSPSYSPQTSNVTQATPSHTNESSIRDISWKQPLHSALLLTSTTTSKQESVIPHTPRGLENPDEDKPSTSSDTVDDIPSIHRMHPAIRRVLDETQAEAHDESAMSFSHELWTDRWRPRRADEVLGNEDRALYLRAWLLALKLHIDSTPDIASQERGDSDQVKKKKSKSAGRRGTKRPQILRQVDKRRKRRRLDSEEPDDAWIVDDESDVASRDYETEDEITMCQRTQSRLQRASTEVMGEACCGSNQAFIESGEGVVPDVSCPPPHFGDQIHSTILLNGPSGCGKTAAVYACAEELGWDVFEVYPGVGERSGAALNKLIGDVGKNHMVRQTQRQKGALFFGNGTAPTPSHSTHGSQESTHGGRRRLKRINSESESDLEPSQTESKQPFEPAAEARPEALSVSQSLILIEEVDILYESDANFWPALINIIKDCRRPVVLTCNDLSLVPVNDLPLQAILTFAPCPVSLATSYLQCMSRADHHPRPYTRATLSRLYERTAGSREGGATLTAVPIPRGPDLRGAILQLQFGAISNRSSSSHPDAGFRGLCTDGTLGPASQTRSDLQSLQAQSEELQAIRRIGHSQDTLSFVDCYLRRRFGDMLTNSMAVEPHVTDRELGYAVLPSNQSAAESAVPVHPSFYHKDELIAAEALPDYQSHLRDMPLLPAELQGYADVRREYGAQMVAALGELRVPADVLTHGSSIFLDYDPWLRYMVCLDDAVAAAFSESQLLTEGARTTRNSQRSIQPMRYVHISEGSRHALMRTALSVP